MGELLKEQDKQKQLIFGDGEVKKAKLIYKSTETFKIVKVPVQFNPSEYSISRSVSYNVEHGISEESSTEKVQSKGSNLASLRVRLILDTATEYPDYVVKSQFSQHIKGDKELSDICRELSLLMRNYPKEHTPSNVTFSWGTMEFEGVLTNLNINYKMFNRNGYPVRVELDLDILGEEKNISQTIGSKPNESPDRTKLCALNQRDELWMLAADEYQDPACWKEIARENGILNPRKIDHTKQLKVPSL